MQPKNLSERRKRILTFSGLYAASVILMLFIFSAFGVRLSVDDKKDSRLETVQKSAAYNTEILHADSLLHARLRLLQGLDDQYTLLLADSGAVAKRNSVGNNIKMYELDFKSTIDSVDQLTDKYSGDKGLMFKTLVNSFKSIANSRSAVKSLQASIASGETTLTDGQQDMLKWKSELSQKDNELAKLQTQIKNLEGGRFTPAKAIAGNEAQKSENEVLKSAFDDQTKVYNDLKETYNRLKTENSSLAAQVVEYRKNALAQAETANTASDSKVNTLEQKIQSLNADVYFAKVDCNLSRADAEQIISNARQRKELLSESLSMLNSLAASGDAGVQKKAKEKIMHLNHIATTLHD